MRTLPFLRLLVGILVAYAVIVGAGTSPVGQAGKVLVLGAVLGGALRIHRRRGHQVLLPVLLTAGLLGLTLAAGLLGSARLVNATLAVDQLVLVATSGYAIVRVLMAANQVDIAAVLGVLCIYLLLALLFSALYQLGAAVQTGFLTGVRATPTAADCLYLSVITLATVGYGDITPATELGRTVAIIEALVGQLYLVSVVAAVVGGWRANRPPG